MPLEFEFKSTPPVHVVFLRGRLDSSSAPEFEQRMRALAERGERHVLLECSELRYVSSVGLGLFVGSAKTLQSRGGNLYFAALTPSVRSVFEMVGFSGLFTIYSSKDEALNISCPVS